MLGNPARRNRFRFVVSRYLGLAAIALCASTLFAARISPAPHCVISAEIGTYPTSPLNYPMPSDRYAVQYKVNGGDWTPANVNVSYYGGSNSSPLLNFSGYSAQTSMSFASIPAQASALVEIRVTKLWDAPFLASDHVSVRPSVKAIPAFVDRDGTVLISAFTGPSFAGEQFVLWWSRGADGGAVESLAFFLNPPYTRPSGPNVKVVMTSDDLQGDLSQYDTLDIEGTLAVPPYPGIPNPVPTGAVAFSVPTNITSIFLAPDSWLQGKLHFLQSGLGQKRTVYGPGVLDVSRFEYDLRFCGDGTGYPDQGYGAISLDPSAKPDKYVIDGIVITDQNLFATDLLSNSTLNNVKDLGWNGNNDGFELGDFTTVSNVFVRSGDDSLKMWRTNVTVTNATVWQNYNGGVVNLGWSQDSHGDNGLIDGLYVIKTDWLTPTSTSWAWNGLAGQNNAVFASLMQPGTVFGKMYPPVFKNIFIEDPPQVLFSLKILPPRCSQGGLQTTCPAVTLSDQATLNLQIENLFSPALLSPPAPAVQNSIGFETLLPGYTLGGADPGVSLPYTLTGSMSIGLTNVFLRHANGLWLPLLNFDSASLGNITTNGNVNITYRLAP
jgi:hypothetical protein